MEDESTSESYSEKIKVGFWIHFIKYNKVDLV